MQTTVDTWEMVLVHRMFRREFRLLPELVRSVPAGDTARARLVAEHAGLFVEGLHHHHTGEDELLWPLLLDRIAPLDADLVHRMETQHEAASTLLGQVDAMLPRWRTHADATTRDELAALLDRLSMILNEHLDDEENAVLPLVSVHITQAEWDALGEHGKRAIPKGGKGLAILGAILEDAAPDERTRFLALLPAPVRLIWHAIGTGVHRRYRTRLRLR